MSAADFLQRYFIEPIYQGTGYNVFNTAAYGIILGMGIMLIQKMLKNLKIEVNRELFIVLLPFLTLAAVLRSLVDAGILPRSFFLITPGIFFTIFLITSIALLIGRTFKNYTLTISIGILLLIYPAIILLRNISTLKPFLYLAPFFMVSSVIALLLFRFFIKNPLGYAAAAAHMLDASATFVGVNYFGYFEEHVVENFLIQFAGTALILFPFKIIVLFAAMSVVEKLEKEAQEFWYLAIFILGFAPGIRDVLTILLLG